MKTIITIIIIAISNMACLAQSAERFYEGKQRDSIKLTYPRDYPTVDEDFIIYPKDNSEMNPQISGVVICPVSIRDFLQEHLRYFNHMPGQFNINKIHFSFGVTKFGRVAWATVFNDYGLSDGIFRKTQWDVDRMMKTMPMWYVPRSIDTTTVFDIKIKWEDPKTKR